MATGQVASKKANSAGDSRLFRSLIAHLKKHEYDIRNLPSDDTFLNSQSLGTIMRAMQVIERESSGSFIRFVQRQLNGETMVDLGPVVQESPWIPAAESRWIGATKELSLRRNSTLYRTMSDLFIVHWMAPVNAGPNHCMAYGFQSVIARDPVRWMMAWKGSGSSSALVVKIREEEKPKNAPINFNSSMAASVKILQDIATGTITPSDPFEKSEIEFHKKVITSITSLLGTNIVPS